MHKCSSNHSCNNQWKTENLNSACIHTTAMLQSHSQQTNENSLSFQRFFLSEDFLNSCLINDLVITKCMEHWHGTGTLHSELTPHHLWTSNSIITLTVRLFCKLVIMARCENIKAHSLPASPTPSFTTDLHLQNFLEVINICVFLHQFPVAGHKLFCPFMRRHHHLKWA